MKQTNKTIKLLKSYRTYPAGLVFEQDVEKAEELVKLGVAEYVVTAVPKMAKAPKDKMVKSKKTTKK